MAKIPFNFHPIPKPLAERGDVTAAAKLIWAVIFNKNGGQLGTASLNTLQKRAGMTRKTAVRAVEELEEKGLLLVCRPGRRRANQYQIPLVNLVENWNQIQPADLVEDGNHSSGSISAESGSISAESGGDSPPSSELYSELYSEHSEEGAGIQVSPEEESEQSDFDNFWQAYPDSPHKNGKAHARQVWQRANLRDHAERIAQHLEHMKAQPDWKKASGRFVPKPSNYLRDETWKDWDGYRTPEQQAQQAERAAEVERAFYKSLGE
ncbi:MAG: helix-turn-helix domain-containing protein [Phycisphaerae bacterium]